MVRLPPPSERPLRRSTISAGMVSTMAATTTRAVTAAPGVQPAANRLDAKLPEVPNVAPDNKARPRPARPAALPSTTSSVSALIGLHSLHITGAHERSQRALCP